MFVFSVLVLSRLLLWTLLGRKRNWLCLLRWAPMKQENLERGIVVMYIQGRNLVNNDCCAPLPSVFIFYTSCKHRDSQGRPRNKTRYSLPPSNPQLRGRLKGSLEKQQRRRGDRTGGLGGKSQTAYLQQGPELLDEPPPFTFTVSFVAPVVPRVSLIVMSSDVMVKKASSTFDAFLALVSRNGIFSSSA